MKNNACKTSNTLEVCKCCESKINKKIYEKLSTFKSNSGFGELVVYFKEGKPVRLEVRELEKLD
jgi:hypothetical protein